MASRCVRLLLPYFLFIPAGSGRGIYNIGQSGKGVAGNLPLAFAAYFL